MSKRKLNIILGIMIILVLTFVIIFAIQSIKEKRNGIIEDTIPVPTNIAYVTKTNHKEI